MDTDRDGARDVDGDYIQWMGRAGGVAVPTHFYAVVVRCVNDEGLEPTDCKADQLDALGMLFQHPTEPGVNIINNWCFLHLCNLACDSNLTHKIVC